MAVTLSPYPPMSSAAGRAAARDFLKSLIGGIAEATDDRVDSLGEAGSEIVERYAPDAPQELKNESVIRIVAYLVAYYAQRSPPAFPGQRCHHSVSNVGQ